MIMEPVAPQKIVLFDFDGVLVETFEMCFALSLRQYPGIDRDTYRDFFDGNVYEAIAKREKELPRREQFDYFEVYQPLLMKHAPVKGIQKMLHALASKHPLIIVSSTINSPIQDYLSMHNLSKYFAEVLGSDFEKSKVKKIQDVINRYGVDAKNAVFVTDTLGDIREAEKVGVASIGVTWGFHPKERLEQGSPAAIIEDPDLLLAAVEKQLT